MSNFNYADAARLIRKGRAAEQRGKAVAGCFGQLIISTLTYLMRGFWLMLAVGVIHHEWWPAIPTLGYWWSVVIVGLLAGIFSAVPTTKDVKS